MFDAFKTTTAVSKASKNKAEQITHPTGYNIATNISIFIMSNYTLVFIIITVRLDISYM